MVGERLAKVDYEIDRAKACDGVCPVKMLGQTSNLRCPK
jgi:hypothetical protein